MTSKNKERFAEWLAVPMEMRQPRTQKELSLILEVKPETLSRWKKDQDFKQHVYEMASARFDEELPDVIQVIIDRAKQGHFQFVKLMLELTNNYRDRIAITPEAPQVGIEQYQAVIKKVAQWKKENFGT